MHTLCYQKFDVQTGLPSLTVTHSMEQEQLASDRLNCLTGSYKHAVLYTYGPTTKLLDSNCQSYFCNVQLSI